MCLIVNWLTYLLDQPTVYGELVRAHDNEDNVDYNSLAVEAFDGFSVTNVNKVRNTLQLINDGIFCVKAGLH